MSTPEGSPLNRPARLAVEVAPIVLLLGLLLYDLRLMLQPMVLFPFLFFLLWPERTSPFGRRLLIVVTLLFGLWLVSTMSGVLTPFVLAFAIAYLLAPAVAWLEARKVPRTAAILLSMLAFFGAFVGLLLILVPEIQRQLFDLVARVPELARRAADWALALRSRVTAGGAGGLLTDEQIARLQTIQASDIVGAVSERWEDIANRLWNAVLGIGRGVGQGLGILLTIIGYFVVAPVVTYYLLKDWHTMMDKCRELVPPAHRDAVFGFLGEYDRTLGRFMRGQVIEAALVAVLTTLGLWVLGFPAAILMGVFAALGNFIPNIGLFLSMIPGLLLALAAPDIGPSLIKLVAVFGVVQFIDASITGPKIVGESVGLNPVWVMLAVLVFGSLLGFLGMFLAVPLAVLVKMFAERALKRYRASAEFGG